jgi:hypothetical protein
MFPLLPAAYTIDDWPFAYNRLLDIDECTLPDKCYGGSCTNLPGNYSCQCSQGTSGNPYIPNGRVKSHTTSHAGGN